MGTRNSHEKYFMLGRAEGKYGRGRPRLIWIDGLKSQIGFSLEQLIQIAINRQEWGQGNLFMRYPGVDVDLMEQDNKVTR